MCICIKEFTGHSGCLVYLMKNSNNQYFVRKISSSYSYNNRLQVQAAKQKLFYLQNTVPHITTPQIYKHGYHKGLYFFDMEYISGEKLCNIIKYTPIKYIENYINNMIIYIKNLPYDETIDSHSVFIEKIASLKKNIKKFDPIINKAFYSLEKFNYSKIPCSPCCGDLTLENILITRTGKIYLIDFLDSFYNSFYIDLAKILQDILCNWSYRFYDYDVTQEIRLLLIRKIFINKIIKDLNININIIYHILLLNLLRIIPYTFDKYTKLFLYKKVSLILSIIK